MIAKYTLDVLETLPLLCWVWGERVADTLTFWLSGLPEERTNSQDKYCQILSQVDTFHIPKRPT